MSSHPQVERPAGKDGTELLVRFGICLVAGAWYFAMPCSIHLSFADKLVQDSLAAVVAVLTTRVALREPRRWVQILGCCFWILAVAHLAAELAWCASMISQGALYW